ncbi:hypothetical protein GCM10028778_14530 [Barrientosiimonas marina]|uniref:NAD(P)-binding domain-containing protein n=1 Tax=Lentibacillus kimchii TaxID=1542911 RepID=A0ABW2UVX5_9BACI
MLLVENCFHWIGFHITRHLLEKGYSIDGVDDLETEKKEHLSLFVGRHNAFRHYQTMSELSEQHYNVIIRIQDHRLRLGGGRSVTVKLPFIFGEWMPIVNNSESDSRQENMPFDLDAYLRGAVYIDDLVQCLGQWIEASQLPAVMEVRSADGPHLEGGQLENYVYVRNNRPVLENAEKVKRHYQRYQSFY